MEAVQQCAVVNRARQAQRRVGQKRPACEVNGVKVKIHRVIAVPALADLVSFVDLPNGIPASRASEGQS
jgi:hypothetical protein